MVQEVHHPQQVVGQSDALFIEGVRPIEEDVVRPREIAAHGAVDEVHHSGVGGGFRVDGHEGDS